MFLCFKLICFKGIKKKHSYRENKEEAYIGKESVVQSPH